MNYPSGGPTADRPSGGKTGYTGACGMMRTRTKVWVGAVALLIGIAFAGCKGTEEAPRSTSRGTATVTPSEAPAKSTAVNTAAAKFQQPLKPEGDIVVKVITNGNSPFWESMGVGLKVGVQEVSASPQTGWSAPEKTDNNSQKT